MITQDKPQSLENYFDTFGPLTTSSKTSIDAKCGVEDFRLLSVYHCQWFGIFGTSIPKFPLCHNYPKTNVTQPSDGVRPHLMQNVELKIYDYFLCFPTNDLEELGPIPT